MATEVVDVTGTVEGWLDETGGNGGAVALPDGRTLLVRPLAGTDAEALGRLYESLGAEDRHRRFFAALRPGRRLLEEMATVADRGGFGLVAELADGTIVGEASYVALPDGDGELAITVAEGWRGWLGPYLLDALLGAAAARGVPNLEADVLVANGPMLALARSRGAVTMAHPDCSVVRLLLGTGRDPTWPPGDGRPRVLVEGTSRWHAEEPGQAAGLQVVACPGPGRRRTPCPALDGRPCPLAAGADVIVVAPGAADLVGVHPDLHPGVPVCADPGTGVPEVVALVQRAARGGPA